MKLNGHMERPMDELSCLKAFASSYKYIADNKDQACAFVNNIIKVPSHAPSSSYTDVCLDFMNQRYEQ